MKEKVKRKKEKPAKIGAPPQAGPETTDPTVAAAVPAAGSAIVSVVGGTGSSPSADAPAATPRRRTKSEAQLEYWRDVKTGKRTRCEKPCDPPKDPNRNPLFDLSELDRANVFNWLREIPYAAVVREKLLDHNLPDATPEQLDEFFNEEVDHQVDMRFSRAATEANALVRLAEKTAPKFSGAILAALGQEAFRQITRGEIDPDMMARMTNLFMKARSDERSDRMQHLRREKLGLELKEKLEQAFEKLAEQVSEHPAAREAFEALRRELTEHPEEDV
jgi:hypothetical protein